MIVEPVAPFVVRTLGFRPAKAAWELAAYHRLRRRAFCEDQPLFDGDDRDAIDDRAIALVCVAGIAGVIDDVVGGVRIWEDAPGAWWGGRLVTQPEHRGKAGVATGLIRLAVDTARRRGARSFHATVQAPNAPLFDRLGWTRLALTSVQGAPHILMSADVGASRGEIA